MKKKVVIIALSLVPLIGIAIAEYVRREANDRKPLILKCTISQSPADSSMIGAIRYWRFPSPEPQWAPAYWSFKEEDWKSYETYGADKVDKNTVLWKEDSILGKSETRIDRNTGDFSVFEYHGKDDLGGFLVYGCGGQESADCKVKERGSCIKSAEPARTLEQKF